VTAVQQARLRNASISKTLFHFIASILLLRESDDLSQEQRLERRDFVMRFQQLTGPVAAKGVEDTAFYRYFPLASLCEVGGTPRRFGVSIDDFHTASRRGRKIGLIPRSQHRRTTQSVVKMSAPD
jgi:(1->4)-alpha-D-glucan 1-alpha-D-glucosylmutase